MIFFNFQKTKRLLYIYFVSYIFNLRLENFPPINLNKTLRHSIIIFLCLFRPIPSLGAVKVQMQSQFEQDLIGNSDHQVDDKNAYDSMLDAYLSYERQKIHPKADQALQLMNIDVCASYKKQDIQFTKQQPNGDEKRIHMTIKRPLIQLYCVTKNSQSVCVNVRDFVPYFYAQFPSEQLQATENNLNLMKQALNQRMKQCRKAIINISFIEATNLYGYQPDDSDLKKKFIKIQMIGQAYVPQLRKYFESGQKIAHFNLKRQTYQSNIPYLLRFMIDKQIVGMGWLRVNPGYQIIRETKKMTRCQLEVNASSRLIESIVCQNQYAKIAPLRILSFDIQCAAQHGFPTPQKDRVIQIACVCKSSNKDIDDYRVVFVLNGSSPISGVHIKNMKTQQQMLQDFQKLVITYDPDFILGYNMINFDLKYLIQRSKKLKMKNYGYFGRNLHHLSKVTHGKFNSKVMGMRETFQIDTDGRIQLDMLIHMHRQHKLTSYRLNNVSYQFIGDQKQDVHHTQITKLFKQGPDGRKRLAIYCLKDAELPLKLMQKLACLYNYSQMARVTGVPINFLLKRGQQIKVVSQLLRKARKKKQHYIMPTIRARNDKGNDVAFQGAFVLDPKPGFYQTPIATLDFASLYPSIMMAHNLCYTTLIAKKDVLNYKQGEVTRTPEDHYFVDKKIREGLLPQILAELITARKKAKKQLAQTTDPMMQKVLDGRQLALKISANSVYGFTGATVGQLPCLQISSSVTSFGRQMIQKTKKLVQQKFKATVIYGDTDSVMVKFPLSGNHPTKQDLINQAMDFGRKAAAQISQQFIKPIKLEFEKVYFPYLLIAKKRYAGVYYTKPDGYDKIDKKGIQAVRRDNCLLIRQMLENVLETILVKADKQLAIKYIQDMIRDLLQNKIDIDKLVITKAISKGAEQEDDQKNNNGQQNPKKDDKKTYKSKQAHTQLAQKMKKRDENIQINIGDRIPYVMINGAKWSKNYDNAEDPKRVLEQDLPIDYQYYINKQIKPPLQRLLKNTGIVENFDLLFSGQHTKIRYAPKVSEKSALGQFVIKKKCCEGCRRQCEQVICQNCKDKAVQIYLRKKQQYDAIKLQKSKFMQECSQCQRFLANEIICQNFDCPIFYKRIKIHKDLQDKQKHLQRFTAQLAW